MSVDPHPLYVYGPVLFVAGSFVASAAVSPLVMRIVGRRFGHLRRPFRARMIGLFLTIASFWIVGSVGGSILLAIPASETPGRLPGDHVDAAVLAHVVPTTAAAACDQLVSRLEHGGAVTRWDPPGAQEARLVLAARIDRDPERAIARLSRHDFRTHAGRFARQHPTPAACEAGLDALAEAVQGGALKELMVACQNAPGDPIGLAAFKVGDFMSSVGPETESIISRQPRAPSGEPTCYAEGPDLPDASMPLCRLIHAELHKTTRSVELDALAVDPMFAKRWIAALRVELGGALDAPAAWGIDPSMLLMRPFAAVIDEPIGVFQDIRQHSLGTLTPGQSAYVRLAIGAERSAMGRHDDAMQLVDEAYRELAIGDGATADEKRRAARLATAIALRAGRLDMVDARLAELQEDDPLRHEVGWIRGEAAAVAEDPEWVGLLGEGTGPELAAALAGDPDVAVHGLMRLTRVSERDRPIVREWLREAYPACKSCGFFAELDRLAARLDAAHSLGDDKMVEALSSIVARFEAVFLNRLLALSLRAADPEPLAR